MNFRDLLTIPNIMTNAHNLANSKQRDTVRADSKRNPGQFVAAITVMHTFVQLQKLSKISNSIWF